MSDKSSQQASTSMPPSGQQRPAQRCAWWWPHVSTWMIAVALTAILALFNIIPDPHGEPQNGDLQQWGWPKVWYQTKGLNFREPLWNETALWADIGVAALIVAAAGTVLDLRRRRRGRLLQFRLTDVFGLMLFIALVGIGPANWYRQTRSARAFREAVANSIEPLDVQIERDVPIDWLWEILHVPDDWRPERIETLTISSQLSPRALQHGRGDTWHQRLLHLETLHDLQLAGFQLKAQDIRGLQALPCLKALGLNNCDLDDEALVAVGELHRVRRFSLHMNPKITATGLRHVAAMHELQSLELRECPGIRGKDLEVLRNCKRLERLRLGCSLPISPNSSFSDSPLDDDDLKSIGQIQSLVALDLHYCDNVTDEGLAHLSRLKNLATLTIVNANMNANITDKGMEHLSRLEKLEHVELYNCGVTDQGRRRLKGLK